MAKGVLLLLLLGPHPVGIRDALGKRPGDSPFASETHGRFSAAAFSTRGRVVVAIAVSRRRRPFVETASVASRRSLSLSFLSLALLFYSLFFCCLSESLPIRPGGRVERRRRRRWLPGPADARWPARCSEFFVACLAAMCGPARAIKSAFGAVGAGMAAEAGA